MLERVWIAVALVVGCCSGASAQSRSFECRAGKIIDIGTASKTVDKVQDAYAGIQALSADFGQDSFVAALEVSEFSSGKVWFSKPGKMKWLYQSPEEQTFLVRNETLWFYQKQENQLTIDEFRNVLISDLPVAFIMGIGDLKKDFKLISACEGMEGTILEFEPRIKQADPNRGASLKSFRLLIGSDFIPRGARVSDVGNNVTAIVLKDLQINPQIVESTFAANFPKGGDINDRRRKSEVG